MSSKKKHIRHSAALGDETRYLLLLLFFDKCVTIEPYFIVFLVLAAVKKMAVMVLNELMSDISMYICLPALRNSLPEDIRVAKSIESFNSLPKTHFALSPGLRSSPMALCFAAVCFPPFYAFRCQAHYFSNLSPCNL